MIRKVNKTKKIAIISTIFCFVFIQILETSPVYVSQDNQNVAISSFYGSHGVRDVDRHYRAVVEGATYIARTFGVGTNIAEYQKSLGKAYPESPIIGRFDIANTEPERKVASGVENSPLVTDIPYEHSRGQYVLLRVIDDVRAFQFDANNRITHIRLPSGGVFQSDYSFRDETVLEHGLIGNHSALQIVQTRNDQASSGAELSVGSSEAADVADLTTIQVAPLDDRFAEDTVMTPEKRRERLQALRISFVYTQLIPAVGLKDDGTWKIVEVGKGASKLVIAIQNTKTGQFYQDQAFNIAYVEPTRAESMINDELIAEGVNELNPERILLAETSDITDEILSSDVVQRKYADAKERLAIDSITVQKMGWDARNAFSKLARSDEADSIDAERIDKMIQADRDNEDSDGPERLTQRWKIEGAKSIMRRVFDAHHESFRRGHVLYDPLMSNLILVENDHDDYQAQIHDFGMYLQFGPAGIFEQVPSNFKVRQDFESRNINHQNHVTFFIVHFLKFYFGQRVIGSKQEIGEGERESAIETARLFNHAIKELSEEEPDSYPLAGFLYKFLKGKKWPHVWSVINGWEQTGLSMNQAEQFLRLAFHSELDETTQLVQGENILEASLAIAEEFRDIVMSLYQEGRMMRRAGEIQARFSLYDAISSYEYLYGSNAEATWELRIEYQSYRALERGMPATFSSYLSEKYHIGHPTWLEDRVQLMGYVDRLQEIEKERVSSGSEILSETMAAERLLDTQEVMPRRIEEALTALAQEYVKELQGNGFKVGDSLYDQVHAFLEIRNQLNGDFRNKRILEIGPRYGRLIYVLQKMNKLKGLNLEILGLENNQVYVNAANKTDPSLPIIQGDFLNLSEELPQSQYDCVYCVAPYFDIWHDLNLDRNVRKFVIGMNRLGKPSAPIVISTRVTRDHEPGSIDRYQHIPVVAEQSLGRRISVRTDLDELLIHWEASRETPPIVSSGNEFYGDHPIRQSLVDRYIDFNRTWLEYGHKQGIIKMKYDRGDTSDGVHMVEGGVLRHQSHDNNITDDSQLNRPDLILTEPYAISGVAEDNIAVPYVVLAEGDMAIVPVEKSKPYAVIAPTHMTCVLCVGKGIDPEGKPVLFQWHYLRYEQDAPRTVLENIQKNLPLLLQTLPENKRLSNVQLVIGAEENVAEVFNPHELRNEWQNLGIQNVAIIPRKEADIATVVTEDGFGFNLLWGSLLHNNKADLRDRDKLLSEAPRFRVWDWDFDTGVFETIRLPDLSYGEAIGRSTMSGEIELPDPFRTANFIRLGQPTVIPLDFLSERGDEGVQITSYSDAGTEEFIRLKRLSPDSQDVVIETLDKHYDISGGNFHQFILNAEQRYMRTLRHSVNLEFIPDQGIRVTLTFGRFQAFLENVSSGVESETYQPSQKLGESRKGMSESLIEAADGDVLLLNIVDDPSFGEEPDAVERNYYLLKMESRTLVALGTDHFERDQDMVVPFMNAHLPKDAWKNQGKRGTSISIEGVKISRRENGVHIKWPEHSDYTIHAIYSTIPVKGGGIWKQDGVSSGAEADEVMSYVEAENVMNALINAGDKVFEKLNPLFPNDQKLYITDQNGVAKVVIGKENEDGIVVFGIDRNTNSVLQGAGDFTVENDIEKDITTPLPNGYLTIAALYDFRGSGNLDAIAFRLKIGSFRAILSINLEGEIELATVNMAKNFSNVAFPDPWILNKFGHIAKDNERTPEREIPVEAMYYIEELSGEKSAQRVTIVHKDEWIDEVSWPIDDPKRPKDILSLVIKEDHSRKITYIGVDDNTYSHNIVSSGTEGGQSFFASIWNMGLDFYRSRTLKKMGFTKDDVEEVHRMEERIRERGYQVIGGLTDRDNFDAFRKLHRSFGTGVMAYNNANDNYSPVNDYMLSIRFSNFVARQIHGKYGDSLLKRIQGSSDDTIRVLVFGTGSGLDGASALYHLREVADQYELKIVIDLVDISEGAIENTEFNFDLIFGNDILQDDNVTIRQVKKGQEFKDHKGPYHLAIFHVPNLVDGVSKNPAVQMPRSEFYNIMSQMDRVMAKDRLMLLSMKFTDYDHSRLGREDHQEAWGGVDGDPVERFGIDRRVFFIRYVGAKPHISYTISSGSEILSADFSQTFNTELSESLKAEVASRIDDLDSEQIVIERARSDKNMPILRIQREDGELIAEIYYKLSAGKKPVLTVEGQRTAEDYQKRGIMTLLYGYLVSLSDAHLVRYEGLTWEGSEYLRKLEDKGYLDNVRSGKGRDVIADINGNIFRALFAVSLKDSTANRLGTIESDSVQAAASGQETPSIDKNVVGTQTAARFNRFLRETPSVVQALEKSVNHTGGAHRSLYALYALYREVGEEGLMFKLDHNGGVYPINHAYDILKAGRQLEIKRIGKDGNWLVKSGESRLSRIHALIEGKTETLTHSLEFENMLASTVNSIIQYIKSAGIKDKDEAVAFVVDARRWNDQFELFSEILHDTLRKNGLEDQVILQKSRESNLRNALTHVNKRSQKIDKTITKVIAIGDKKALAHINRDINERIQGEESIETVIAPLDYDIFDALNIPWVAGILTVAEAAWQQLNDRYINFNLENIPAIGSIEFRNGVLHVRFDVRAQSGEMELLHQAELAQLKSV